MDCQENKNKFTKLHGQVLFAGQVFDYTRHSIIGGTQSVLELEDRRIVTTYLHNQKPYTNTWHKDKQ